MLRLLVALAPAFRSAMRSRRDLLPKNLALRQQLATFVAKRRPRIRPADRVFWVLLSRAWTSWTSTLAIVEPGTVIRWHRAGFRAYWAWLAHRGRTGGRPPLPREILDLIRRMAAETTWGAPRIHGELLRLGFAVSERTVSRFLRRIPRPTRPGRQTWSTFLRNHRAGLAAMDLFTVPTATFRLLIVLVVIRHGRREVVRCAVTGHPTAAWIAQQLREAFPFESAPRYLLHDRDAAFSGEVRATLRSMGVEPVRTSFRSPWQNGVVERFISTVRHELLDHVIVLGESHLRGLLEEFSGYYHEDRTHLGIGKDTPHGRPVDTRSARSATVVSLPRVGGLHRRYAWRRAA
jgi:putative transposase